QDSVTAPLYPSPTSLPEKALPRSPPLPRMSLRPLRSRALFFIFLFIFAGLRGADLTELTVTTLSPEAALVLTPPATVAPADLPRKTPPSPLFGDVLVRTAQAHILGASLTGPR